MFTGIVEESGRVKTVEPAGDARRITFEAHTVTADLRTGDSIAVDGVCQTVVACDVATFTVLAIETTLARTTLGALKQGDAVNLERALRADGRMGGHFVQGHVDGTGEVLAVERRGEHILVNIALPEDVAEVTVPRGSIAVHGVSLTVDAVTGTDVQVALIPWTAQHTNLGQLRVGDRVNVEGDMIGRFVAHLLARQRAG